MHLGFDFDNTIVCYDTVFEQVALSNGWIGPGGPRRKVEIRDQLQRQNRNDLWTVLQGLVYGRFCRLAQPFPGALNVLARFRRQGHQLQIISHKSRFPMLGEPVDLHAAAMNWLQDHGICASDGAALAVEDVSFWPSRAEKLRAIGQSGCDVFVDDLPEVLEDHAFPPGTARILFVPSDPENPSQAAARREDKPGDAERDRARPICVASWAEIEAAIAQIAADGAAVDA